jgi:hypothetical protein
MPYSAISRAELNQDDTINLVVRVEGFLPGEPIEISGQATQADGAVATFYYIQVMPDDGIVVVPSIPAILPNKFVAGSAITVVARASQVWMTTLQDDSDPVSRRENMVSGQSKAAWKTGRVQWAVGLGAQEPATTTPGGQQTATTLIHHGTWWDGVKRDPLDVVMGGRFTRLFPDLPPARFDREDLEKLAREMIAPPKEPVPLGGDDPEENKTIPAAYTYLGQFVDHDLTFDPTSNLRQTLTTRAQLQALVDFRTPRFDLDNLYGRGPDDQPYMYEEDGIHMLPGEPLSGNPFDPGAVQLPRGPNGRALIGDPRDDENRIIAQLHAVFLRFHNKVADLLGGKKHVSFQDVRQQVQWHYQWILVHDFLPTILEENTYNSVFADPYRPVPTIPGLRENDLGLMPVEFSVAAYRFGHSMVRPQYRLNTAIESPLFSSVRGAADLRGFRPIPDGWAIDWQFFIDLEDGAGPAAGAPQPGAVPREPQLSYKIDTSLVHPLGDLPARIAKDPSSLALRNLERGSTFQLPSGQRVAEALGIPPIADQDLMIGKATADSENKAITDIADVFAGNAPLWAYVLSEAQVTSLNYRDGKPADDKIPVKLGPLGGRLVAEVFASLLRGDHASYLYAKPKFKPIADFAPGGTFGLAELINVALRRRAG